MNRRVVIVQKTIPQYRISFFEGLRERLAAAGIELVVVYGRPAGAEASKGDSLDLEWGRRVDNRIFSVRGRQVIWQPVLSQIERGDLVIVEQASKLAVNYVLLARHLAGQLRFAFWGHGRNLQPDTATAAAETVKRWVSKRAHWWFAYTTRSSGIVSDLGFPSERVTTVQNAIDTGELARAKAAISPADLAEARRRMGIVGEHTAVFCGALYKERRPEFLIAAAEAARRVLPDFELIVVGAGAAQGIVEEAARRHPWIKYRGPAFGADKAACFLASQALLNPGPVGLAVVDAFVFETPLVAIDGIGHGPEIEYLEDDVNGVLLPPGTDADAYGKAVAALVADPQRRSRLAEGCRQSAARYTVENMIDRFADGVQRALAA